MILHSDASLAISQMSHTLTTSLTKTKLTFMAVLKELVRLPIANRKTFCQNPKMHQRSLVSPLWVVLAQLSCLWWPLWLEPLCHKLHLDLLCLLSGQEVPYSQLIQAEVLPKLGIKQQCLKEPDLKLIDLTPVRQLYNCWMYYIKLQRNCSGSKV